MLNLNKIILKLKQRSKNQVLRGMLTVAIITFFLKALAFYKETIIASSFGLSDILDTFLVALLIPSFVQSVFLSSLKNLFIPNYIIELKNNGDKSGFQSVIFIMSFAISIVSVLIAYFFIDIFLSYLFPNHTYEYYELVKSQLLIILPCLILWGFSTVISGLLEVSSRFFVATIYQFLPIVTMIIFLTYFKEYFGSMVLAYGTLTGSIIGFTMLVISALSFKEISLSKPKINSNARMMLRELPPKIASSFLSSMNNFIDQFFAGQLVVGSIAALSYGNRVPAFGVTIVITALGSVLLPHFSRLVTTDLKGAYHYLFKVLKIVVISGIIAVIIIILFSDSIVELWLQRDEFTAEDTIKVSTIQKILLANVPFYLCTLIIVKFLTSINKNRFMAKISFLNLFVNISLNLILIKYYGVFGLAISTSLVLIISSSFYFGYTYNQYKKLKNEN